MEIFMTIWSMPKPVIAAVRGHAVDQGCELAGICDLTIATEDAVLCEVFTKLNLSLDGGGAWLLPRLVGLKKAKELALFGDKIPAREAERLGLVNCVVPAAGLEAQLKEWATRLATGPTRALSLTKAMLNDAYALSFEQAIEEESRSQTILAKGIKKPSV
jgi:2-(1,2-epoxy-1,2-dihydrophenyl)acetyl-CoA isomerase